MAQYTRCFDYQPGKKPFHEDDLVELALAHGLAPGALVGLLTGLLLGGPTMVGLLIAVFFTTLVGLKLALEEAADRWLNERLVCLTGRQCAIGTVRKNPVIGDLGEFDNDEFFDLQLMPHPMGPGGFEYDYATEWEYTEQDFGPLKDATAAQALADHKQNDLYHDIIQGWLVRPDETLSKYEDGDLPYNTTISSLHCEAEGDFWVRMRALAGALSLLAALLAVTTTVATGAGAGAGAALGCAIGSFFGPLGCLIGAILGGLLGGLLAGGASAVISYLIIMQILRAIFETNPGDVDDLNFGDDALGPIVAGDRIVVYGEHVYDGFHTGWNEIHPLVSVVKLADKKAGAESNYYLEWDPEFGDFYERPEDLPGMPPNITNLTMEDMRQGLDSVKFNNRVRWLRDRWCELMREPWEPPGRHTQDSSHGWAVHPEVDGCEPGEPEPPPLK